jgi:holo-[acyl-carrier protein] synthase
MIIGIGSDITDIRRIERLIKRFGDRFVRKYFTDKEIEKSGTYRKNPAYAASLAKRFAAKEACAKALGSGFKGGVSFRDISVVNDKRGKPSIILSGGAMERLKEITPIDMNPTILLSLSDEPPMALAFVVIETL